MIDVDRYDDGICYSWIYSNGGTPHGLFFIQWTKTSINWWRKGGAKFLEPHMWYDHYLAVIQQSYWTYLKMNQTSSWFTYPFECLLYVTSTDMGSLNSMIIVNDNSSLGDNWCVVEVSLLWLVLLLLVDLFAKETPLPIWPMYVGSPIGFKTDVGFLWLGSWSSHPTNPISCRMRNIWKTIFLDVEQLDQFLVFKVNAHQNHWTCWFFIDQTEHFENRPNKWNVSSWGLPIFQVMSVCQHASASELRVTWGSTIFNNH